MGLHGKIVHGAISGPTAAAGHPAAVIVSSAHLFDGSAPGPLTWIPTADSRSFCFISPGV